MVKLKKIPATGTSSRSVATVPNLGLVSLRIKKCGLEYDFKIR